MKACLMKVNYDHKFTQPHKGYEPLQSRIHMAREVYNAGKEKKLLKESLEEAAKRKLRQHEQNRLLLQSMAHPPDRSERHKRKSADSNQTSNMSRISSHMSFQRNDTPMALSVLEQRDSPAMRSQPNTKLQPLPPALQTETSKDLCKAPGESHSSDQHTDLYKSFLLATSKFDVGEKDYPSVLYAPRPLQSYNTKVQFQPTENRFRGNAAPRKGKTGGKLKSAPGQLYPQRLASVKFASLPERIKKAYSSSSAQNNFAAYKAGPTKVPKTASGTTEVLPPRGIHDLTSLDVHKTDIDENLYNFLSPRNKRPYKKDSEKYDPNYIKTVSILDTPRSELALPELKPRNDPWDEKVWATLRNFQSPLKGANYHKVHSYQEDTDEYHRPFRTKPSTEDKLVRQDSLSSFILSRSAYTDRKGNRDAGAGVQNEVPQFSGTDEADVESYSEEGSESDSAMNDSEGRNTSDREDIEESEDSYTEPSSSSSAEEFTTSSDREASVKDDHDGVFLSTDLLKTGQQAKEEEESLDSEDIPCDRHDVDIFRPVKPASASARTSTPITEEMPETYKSSSENILADSKQVSFLEDNANNLQLLMQKNAHTGHMPHTSVEDIENDYFRDVFYVSEDSCGDAEPSDDTGKSSDNAVANKMSNTSQNISSRNDKHKHKGNTHKTKKDVASDSGKTSFHWSKNYTSHPKPMVDDARQPKCDYPGVFKEVKLAPTRKEHRTQKANRKSAKLKQEKHSIKVEQRSKDHNPGNQLTIHDIHPKWESEEVSRKDETDEKPDVNEEVQTKWAKRRKQKVRRNKPNSLQKVSRLYSKSTPDLKYSNEFQKPDVKSTKSKPGIPTKSTSGILNVGLKGSLEYESSPVKAEQDKSSMLKYSHYTSAGYGSDLTMSQRLTSQRYVNAYSVSPGPEIQGIKKSWKKPKPQCRLFEYNSNMGYMAPLRVVQSTEDLSSHLRSKSGNPYIDTHNEIMNKMSQSSARGPRRHRPRSVSDQIRSVLGIQCFSATPHEFDKSRATTEEDPLKRLGYAQKMYARKAHSSVNMMATLRARLANRVTLSSDLGGNSYAPIPYSRSRTVVPSELSHSRIVKNAISLEQEKKAKAEADRAMKQKKVFTIIGPYHGLRAALRRRGWVEKFVNAPLPGDILATSLLAMKKKAAKENGDDIDDGTADLKVKPWEEENGYYGMMSHVVRNSTPSFVFTIKNGDVDTRLIRSGQMVNHFGKSKHITTKVGLCQSLRNVQWFDKTDCYTFYPRCYKMDEKEERDSFIDDYRITSCFGFIKVFVEKYQNLLDEYVSETNKENIERTEIKGGKRDSAKQREPSRLDSESRKTSALKKDSSRVVSARKVSESRRLEKDSSKTSLTQSQSKVDLLKDSSSATQVTADNPDKPADGRPQSSQEPSGSGGDGEVTASVQKPGEVALSVQNMPPVYTQKRLKKGGQVSGRALEVAYEQCLLYLKSKAHEDIDTPTDKDSLTEGQWDQFLVWYYNFVHDGGDVKGTPNMYAECKLLLVKLAECIPQFDMEGSKNIWILKPGAKSRGRGITLCDKMGACLNYVEKDSSLVIQKYIEKPLLIYNTKFDIRQWFLVTDWNPLTVWFYKDSYLRFCSQEFSTDDYHVSIHLSNNFVQKNFQNGSRASQLPDDNMWTSDEFLEHLRVKGKSSLWYDKVLPGMKNAIICALLCSQEHIENRKSAFELYGADFMLGEELDPWLIEINSSPSMGKNTKATVKLVDGLLDDVCKVVLDHKIDKTSDTGGFELLYSQKYVSEPPMVDLSLCVTGRKIRKKDKR